MESTGSRLGIGDLCTISPVTSRSIGTTSIATSIRIVTTITTTAPTTTTTTTTTAATRTTTTTTTTTPTNHCYYLPFKSVLQLIIIAFRTRLHLHFSFHFYYYCFQCFLLFLSLLFWVLHRTNLLGIPITRRPGAMGAAYEQVQSPVPRWGPSSLVG